MREQLRKQINRLRELRIKKIEEPGISLPLSVARMLNDSSTDTFYGGEDDPVLHNVDVMTDISMAPTAFTRYTVAPTAASRTSR
jgi:elongator complex protein 1